MTKILNIVLVLLIVYALMLAVKQPNTDIDPINAIRLAAEVATDMPSRADGVFDLTIQATGSQNNIVYLNSEKDYRDQRNLSISLSPIAQLQLIKKFNKKPQDFFKGKHLKVTGVAKRVKIFIYANGKKLKTYYYQTHVNVTDSRQIRVINPAV